MNHYLDAAQSAVETLIEKQSAPAGGKPEGTVCITVTRPIWTSFRSVGARRGDAILSYAITASPMEMQPCRMDFRAWPMLELFSDVTGDPKYRQRVVAMAEVFGRHGFEPSSGLGYLGEEADYDVVKQACVPVYVTGAQFKPMTGIPLERLWTAAPEATARMIRSAYYGLVNRPETMDFNRHCLYGFDDSTKKPAYAFNSHHAGFAMSGATLLHWWGFLFARTGDAECLKWAQAMADKWRAVQHPRSGFLPAWFGSDHDDEDTMPPRPYCNYWDTITGISFLRAAAEWRVRPEGAKLATQLAGMGQRVIAGFARHAYDAPGRSFPMWMNLDGSARTELTWYAFYSQQEKDEYVKKDPLLNEATVFANYGFYVGLPWVGNAGVTAWGSNVPHDVAHGSKLTGDAYLLARAEELAAIVIEEARKQTGEFTDRGQWTMTANACYIKMMLLLFEMTRNARYLDWAREIADMELEFLSRPLPLGKPEWWRLPLRNSWIESLLLLHRELTPKPH